MTTAQDEFNALFKDNKDTAGRRHPEDQASSHQASDSDHNPEAFYEHDDDGDDLDDDNDTLFSKQSQSVRHSSSMRSRYFLPRQRSEANTGPKGVIADAQAFEQAKRSQRLTFFRSSPPRDTKSKSTLSPPPSRLWGSRSNSRAPSTSEEEDDDDEFMVQWRQRRLRELQAPTPHKKAQSTNLAVRMYGRLIAVESEGFLEAVESTPTDTVVAVYIYDDMSDVSFMVEECIRQLARKHTNTRFIKMHFEEAEMEAAGVPALLAYRGGNKFAGLVPLVDEIPDDAELSAATLESVFQKHQIL